MDTPYIGFMVDVVNHVGEICTYSCCSFDWFITGVKIDVTDAEANASANAANADELKLQELVENLPRPDALKGTQVIPLDFEKVKLSK